MRLPCDRVVVVPHRLDSELAHERDRRRRREVRRGIARPRQVELGAEPAVEPPRDAVGVQFGCRSGGVQRMPLLRGTHSHLCRLPTYQSTPSDGMSSASAPGACAPSASTATPRARRRSAIAASGSTSPLSRRHVIDDGEPRRSGVIAPLESLDHLLRRPHGYGIAAVRTAAPRSRAANVSGALDAAVAEVGDENLVAGAQRKRLQDGVDAGRRVVDEREVVAADAHQLADDVGGLTQARLRPRGWPTTISVSSRRR